MSPRRLELETNEHFPLAVRVEILASGRHVMMRKFRFIDPVQGAIEVPAGFSSDGFSFPWFVRFFWPKEQPSMKAAYVHDYLFETQTVSLAGANAIMQRAMQLDPTPLPRWKQRAIMAGLHVGSWVPWYLTKLKR